VSEEAKCEERRLKTRLVREKREEGEERLSMKVGVAESGVHRIARAKAVVGH